MRKKTSGQINPGEFLLPGDNTPAQREFFRAIERSAPEVLVSLRKRLLPEFRRCCETDKPDEERVWDLYEPAWDWAAGHGLVVGERLIPLDLTCRGLSQAERQARDAALVGSCEQTFFFPFAFFAIWGTLKAWHDDPRGKGDEWVLPHWPYAIDGCDLLMLRTRLPGFRISDLFIAPNTETRVPFRFRCGGWNPFQEKRLAAKKRILAEAKKALDAYMRQVKKLMTAFDVSPAPVRQSPEHFDWLVLYQLGGKRYGQIAKHDDVALETQAIADGIRKAAMQVVGPNWKKWLRPSEKGRPKGRAKNN